MSAVEAWFCRSRPWHLVARRLVPWATQGIPLTGEILEIGGGSGAMAEELARTHPAVRLTTTDCDPAMVRAAKARLAPYPLATACRADATDLPFGDQRLDVVVSFLMLHHVIEWEQAMIEAARVLRPGGTFIGCDLTASRAASWLHLADKSPHLLIDRADFGPALARAGLPAATLHYSFGGRLLRFAAAKPS